MEGGAVRELGSGSGRRHGKKGGYESRRERDSITQAARPRKPRRHQAQQITQDEKHHILQPSVQLCYKCKECQAIAL